MLYRKLPQHPPTVLLRIVATVGTGALLGAVACSSQSDTGHGNDASPEASASDAGEDAEPGITGLMCYPGVCGVVANPDAAAMKPDTGDADSDAAVQQVGGGISVSPDSGPADAEADHMVYGLIVHPGDGGQD
jgi:hypothetical protein